MTSAIWLNIAAAVVLVGGWALTVLYGYRALARDQQRASAVPAPALATARPREVSAQVRAGRPADPASPRATGGKVQPGRQYTMAHLAR